MPEPLDQDDVVYLPEDPLHSRPRPSRSPQGPKAKPSAVGRHEVSTEFAPALKPPVVAEVQVSTERVSGAQDEKALEVGASETSSEEESRVPVPGGISEPGPLVDDPAIKVARRFIEEQRRLGADTTQNVVPSARAPLFSRRRRWRT